MKRRVIIIALLAMTLIPGGAVFAAPSYDTIITVEEGHVGDLNVEGEDLEIEEGATVDGNVSVFGGDSEIEGEIDGDVAALGGDVELEGLVTGSVVLVGGDMTISGSVDGDIVLFGGDLTVNSTATIAGECVLIGGNLKTDNTLTSCADSTVNLSGIPFVPGSVAEGMPMEMDSIEPPTPPERPEPPTPPTPPTRPESRVGDRVGHFFGEVGEVIFSTLIAGGVAFLVASVLPGRVTQIRSAIEEKPAASGVVGVLTAVAGPSLMALLAFISGLLVLACGLGLLGFPIVIALAVALALASIFGWVAIGSIIGDKIAPSLKIKNQTLPMTAAIGTGAITFILTALGLISFFPAEFIMGLVACVGLGAAALTKFGTRAYPPVPLNNAKVEAILDSLPD